MKRETTLLKLALLLIALPVLGAGAFSVIGTGKEIRAQITAGHAGHPFWIFATFLMFALILLSAALVLTALWQAYRILRLIERDTAFSDGSMRALGGIKRCAFAGTLAYLVCMPALYAFAESGDAPGLLLIALILLFCFFVVTVFAAVLQKLLGKVLAIKTENDLTI